MNFLIIGTGHISKRFADALGSLGITPHSVYSRSASRAEEFGAAVHAKKSYSELTAALCDAELDAVYVASPNVCHAEHAIAALEAGKHVLCEKAMATSYSEYLEMQMAADSNERLLIEAMRPAYDPATEVIEKAISQIGKIRHASLTFCQYSSRYDAFKSGTVLNAFDPKMKNSALADIGVYPLYMALRLFGEPASAERRSVYLENGFEGAGTLSLCYPDMLCEVSYSKIHDSHRGSIVEGEDGAVCFDKMNSPSSVKILDLRGNITDASIPKADNNMTYEIDAFMKTVRGELPYDKHRERSRLLMKILDSVNPY